jgi:hypothetical protein
MSSELDRFLAAASRPLRTKEVRVGAETFTLRELSDFDASEMEVAMQSGEKFDFAKHRRLLVSYCLGPIPRPTIGKLYEECLKLSEYDAGEIEALAKKSDATGG